MTVDVVAEERLSTSRFGEIRIFGNKDQARSFVIFFSDIGGWTFEDDKLVTYFTAKNSIVAGIDSAQYLEELMDSDEECHYIAGEIERLAQVVQQNIALPQFYPPLIAGYKDGGSLVYAILAQGPRSIKGGLSIGFCPSIKIGGPFCEGDYNVSSTPDADENVKLLPVKKLNIPWYLIRINDAKCGGREKENFGEGIDNVQIFDIRSSAVTISGTISKFVEIAPSPTNISSISTEDLPLIDVHAQRKEKDYFAILISGDGGWASIDKEIGEYLSDQGVSVVGVDALRYFWKKKTPEQAGRDLDRIIRDYKEEWNKENVVLIGYSLGADVLPFMFNNMSKEMQAKVRKIILLNAAKSSDMQVHITDWVGIDVVDDGKPILPELKKIDPKKLYCIYGLDDEETICKDLNTDVMKTKGLPGSHHFNEDYQAVSNLILKELN